MHPDRRLDAGRLLPVPDQLAVRPQERHHSVHRPGLPGAAPAGAHPGHQARIVRHLRLPRRETRSQAGELSQAGQRRGDHLLEPQQSGMDLPHRERAAHHRRAGHPIRHDRSRRPRLHGHGFPQGAGTSVPGSVPGHRSPLHRQLRADDFRLEDLQLRRPAHRHRSDLGQTAQPLLSGSQGALRHRPFRRILRPDIPLRRIVRRKSLGSIRFGGHVQSGGGRQAGLRGAHPRIRTPRSPRQGTLRASRFPHRL